jgi:hypothetical protein
MLALTSRSGTLLALLGFELSLANLGDEPWKSDQR